MARCTLVWLGTTGAGATVGWWASLDLRHAARSTTPSFDVALAATAALVLLACTCWAWTVTTVVVVAAVRDRRRGTTASLRAVPDWARRFVLTACGVALVGAAQLGPASAEPGPGAVVGLSLPDRTTGGLAGDRGAPAPLTVRPGDSLWSLAEGLLGPGASTAGVADLVRRLHDSNRAEIGPDPGLIHPGLQLRTPPGLRPTR